MQNIAQNINVCAQNNNAGEGLHKFDNFKVNDLINSEFYSKYSGFWGEKTVVF